MRFDLFLYRYKNCSQDHTREVLCNYKNMYICMYVCMCTRNHKRRALLHAFPIAVPKYI